MRAFARILLRLDDKGPGVNFAVCKEKPMNRTTIPLQGRSHDDVLTEMSSFREHDADYKAGKTWSLVYYCGEEHSDFLKKAHNTYFSENGLNPMAFKSLKRMEAEVVQMASGLLNADQDAVGTMTSGGTESLLMAVKAARDRARKLKPWIRRPNMVLPTTIHVGVDKAAHYFGVKPIYVEISDDFRANVKAMEKACNRNTILIAASAPQYPFVTIDPIEELGQLALRKKLPFHVDACFGGFMLPWLERLGHPLPLWDFRVPGVTSISADIHKYGYASKGASVLIYKDMSYLKHQFFISTNWPGGIYASPSMPGTRPGGPIAAAWATMMAMGEDGYIELAKKALDTTKRLRAGIEGIPELRLLGEFHMTAVTWAAKDDVSVFAIADMMAERGWGADRQQNPPSIHLTVNANNAESADQYLADLAECAAHVAKHPELADEGEAAMYGMMAKVPVRGLVKHSIGKVMESMYSASGEVPDLTKLGEGDDDGIVMKMINRYGDQAMAVLDKINSMKPGTRA